MRFPKMLNVRYAVMGLWTALREETQVFWGFACVAGMLATLLWRGTTYIEVAVVAGLFGATIALEMFNGVAERLCNKISPYYDEDIKKIKDIAAGAVLLMAWITLAVWILFLVKG